MKRLKLEDFNVKNLKKKNDQEVDQLLGQILGNCYDSNQAILLDTWVDPEGEAQ